MKITVVCDVECYTNYMLMSFKRVDNGAVVFFERCEDHETYIDTGRALNILRHCRVVTFNGRTYDYPMMVAALRGASNAQLKALSDRILQQNLKWWDIERELGIEVPASWDHIDLSEPAPGVMIPLKLYGARMHSKRLQDLPVEPSAYLTDEQIVTLRDYNINSDLPMTIDLWNALKGDIELREHMTAQYRIDMRSKSGAQIAEAIIKSEVGKIMGQRPPQPEIDFDRKLEYVPPAFLTFRTQQLANLFITICSIEFEIAPSGAAKLPPSLSNAKIKIGSSQYKLGIGGLHSTEKSQTLYADEGHEIHDDDVASYYPSIILVCGLFPPNMGRIFLDIFRKIFDDRISAKHRAGELKKEIAEIDARIKELEHVEGVSQTWSSN